MDANLFNSLFFLLSGFLCFGGVLLFKWLFGRVGLYVWIGIMLIFANIEVTKTVEMFWFKELTLGNSSFGAVFLATSILQEEYGDKHGWRALAIGFASVLTFVGLMQLVLIFKPADIDFSQEALVTIFTLSPRINGVSLGCALLANCFDVFIFAKLRKSWKGRFLGLRSFLSDIVPNVVENFVFDFGAFLGVYTAAECFNLALGGSVLELFCSVFAIPAIYLSRKIKPLHEFADIRSVESFEMQKGEMEK